MIEYIQKMEHEDYTRGDWRIFERLITTTTFINQIMNYEQNKRYKKKPVFNLVYTNMRETDFVIAYYYIYTYGIHQYISLFGGDAHIILSNKILNDRNELYKTYVCRSF
jgi:hypothetical protein